MDITNFINDFADQFDETDLSEFTPETAYRDLDEWSSLTGLAIMNMIEKKYGIKLAASELRGTETIQDVFDLMESKQK